MTIRRFILALVAAASLMSSVAAQCSEAKLIPSAPGGWFGQSVAVEGDTAVIGAPLWIHLVHNGVPYVFEKGPQGWVETQQLGSPPVSGTAHVGWSVAISGDWIAVGAPRDAAFSSPAGSGSVFLYSRTALGWSAPLKIKAAVPKQGALFGKSIAMSGDWLVVGAPEESTPGNATAGAVYFFVRQGSTWVQASRVSSRDEEAGALFGHSVAIRGDRALIGSPYKDERLAGVLQPNTGSAYVLERSAVGWEQVAKLVPPPQAQQKAGWSVALLEATAFVGALEHAKPLQGNGACFIFEGPDAGWSLAQILVPQDANPQQHFGSSLSASGRHLLVGSESDGDLGATSGSAYLFKQQGSQWLQIAKILGSDTTAGNRFGTQVALWEDVALVGSPRACIFGAGCDSGSAHVFRTSTNVKQSCSCPLAAPCGNPDDFGGCSNSTGQGAVLSACGEASVSLDDLQLEARWMPANSFALLFMGGGTVSSPFGDGRLCVGPGGTGIHRYASATTSPAGSLHYGPGIAGLSQSFPPSGHIQPGDTWGFQVWFRDPGGPCGSAANLTNALRVTFQP